MIDYPQSHSIFPEEELPQNGSEQTQERSDDEAFADDKVEASCLVDIARCKQVEEALQESESFNHSVFESSADCIKVLDLDGYLISMNTPGSHLIEAEDPRSLVGTAWIEFWQGNERVTAAQAVQTANVGGTSRFSGYCPTVKGTPKWWDVVVTPILDISGKPKQLLVISRDISDRKQIEADLRESESRLRFMLDSTQIGEWDLDLTTQPYTACRSLRHDQIFGYESLLSEWSYEIFLTHIHPDDRDSVNKKFQQTLSTSTDWNFECRIIHLDHSVRWIWARSSIYCNPEGTPTRLLGMVMDITDRKVTEAERERLLQQEQAAREEAERANRIKDEFLAVLSHELRSPLNPILGWAKLLRRGKLDQARTAEALATIERNAKLQSQLIEDLLDISRIMQGKLALTVAPVSLAFVISSAIETVRLAAEAKNIEIELHLEPNLGQVYGDAGRLQQVVWNLLSNAVKFTPTGGRVEVRLMQFNHQAQVQVIDTGKGISSEFLPYVFEHFRQEDGATTRKFGGLGLGLAIASQIVDLHGGRIWVESLGEQQGATFTVELPFLQTVNLLEEIDHSVEVQSDNLPLANLRVLIVDDEPDSRDFVVFIVEQAGAKVTAVGSAIEALQVLSTASFDLLLSDIGMPEMDGYELMRRISSEIGDRVPTLAQAYFPAIALTAYAGEINQQQALAAGFQGHVTKPVEPDELIETVVTLMRIGK